MNGKGLKMVRESHRAKWDPNYRLAIMQMLLQRDHFTSAAQELWLWLELRHKKTPNLFIIVFNYLPNDRAGIPAAR